MIFLFAITLSRSVCTACRKTSESGDILNPNNGRTIVNSDNFEIGKNNICINLFDFSLTYSIRGMVNLLKTWVKFCLNLF